jgi:hypothetical protein
MVKIPQLWQTVKQILGSKSRGARLMAVGVLLLSIGEISDIVRGILCIPREGSNPILLLGEMAFIWGAMSYIFGWEKTD